MLKLDEVGPTRRLAGVMCLTLVCTGGGMAAWAAQPAVTVFAAAPPVVEWRRVETPEMRPTGVMIPAYGSHPPGTPADQIPATTAEMTPTGAMRVVMEPAPSQPVIWLEPPASSQLFRGVDFNGLTRAEARGERVSVEGELVRVMMVNPQAQIVIRDASGQEVTVASETPNSLLRQGINRQTLQPGMRLRMDGFRGEDGSIQARGAGFSSNGVRLATSDNYGNPLPAAQAPGAVIDRSPLSNSVVREGTQQSTPIQPPQRPTVITDPEWARRPGAAIITNPTWEQRPGAAELGAVFPERAIRMEQSGTVRLRCDVEASGAVSGCEVISEAPAGYGFGEAALRLQPFFRMKPTTPDGAAVGGARVEVPVAFRLQ